MRLLTPSRTNLLRRGFTVLELMLSVAIMTVIVIGLYTVFDATQKALRSTMSQVDVLEGIRASSDLMVRDLESATPLKAANTNFSFAVYQNPFAVSLELEGLRKDAVPVLRTALQDLFFVTRQNDTWTAIGYWVGPANTNQLGQAITVGRLYRYSYETNGTGFSQNNFYARFNGSERIRNSQMVMDGVVHMRVVCYDRAGNRLVVSPENEDPPQDASGPRELDVLNKAYGSSNTDLSPWFADPARNTRTAYRFSHLTVPAFPSAIELEFAVLEPQVVTRAASIPNVDASRDFLKRHAGNVHFFRQRIPFRNASPF